MADQTNIHTGFAGLTQAPSLSTPAVALAWMGGRGRVEDNPKSLTERWKG